MKNWLNEGTADWSALLYALHRNNEKLFNFIINMRKQEADLSKPLKPADGSRSPYAHSNSTLLFLDIYLKYGEETIRKIVQLFVDLEIKTTQTLLEKIKENLKLEIAEGICKKIG